MSNDTYEVEIGHLVDNPETSVQVGDLKFDFTVMKGLTESVHLLSKMRVF